MDIQLRDSALQAMLARKKPDQTGSDIKPARPDKTPAPGKAVEISLSLNPLVVTGSKSAPQTRLVREENIPTEDGFQRAQDFETGDGRTFSKSESISISDTGSRRLVIQQNSGGSITSLEEVFDQQPDGSFRKISRFMDASGQIETKVETDLSAAQIVNNKTTTLYNGMQFDAENRGNRLDVRA